VKGVVIKIIWIGHLFTNVMIMKQEIENKCWLFQMVLDLVSWDMPDGCPIGSENPMGTGMGLT
jgi:hypothetical protein